MVPFPNSMSVRLTMSKIPSPSAGEIKDLKVKIGDKVSEGSILATIENGQAASAPKEREIKKEVQTEEKPKTNGELNQVRQVKKVFAEPASKDDIDTLSKSFEDKLVLSIEPVQK